MTVQQEAKKKQNDSTNNLSTTTDVHNHKMLKIQNIMMQCRSPASNKDNQYKCRAKALHYVDQIWLTSKIRLKKVTISMTCDT
jgi:hypothetical protein